MSLSPVLNSAAGYFICAFASYLVCLVGYRLLLHPLRGYPGPPAAKIFDGYGAYHSFSRCLHIVTRQDHLKYGPVIRQGPNKLVFNTAKALHDIHESERVQKASTYLATKLGPHYNIFNVIDARAHRIKRRLIGSVLSERSMRIFEPTMTEQINVFIKQLLTPARASTPVNVSQRVKFMALDIVGLLAFGYQLKLQTSSKNRHMIGRLKGGNHRLNTYMQYPLLAKLHLEVVVYVLMLMKKESYLRLLESMIASRLKEEKHAKYDLYSVVIDAMQASPGDNITVGEIWSEALFFFPAGGESVTTAINGLLFYLSRNKQSYETLAQEIRSTFKTSDEIRGGPQLAGCQYLRACIDETLRMAPPGPGTMWRERSSTDDRSQPLVIDGHVIPEGTLFGVNIYAIHHNEDYFQNPFTFSPERWLPAHTPEPQRKRMHSAFAPFLLGSRGCGGKAMAYLEVSLVVAKTLWYYDFEKAQGPLGDLGGGTGSTREVNGRERRDEFQLYDIFTADHEGPNLVFTARSEAVDEIEMSE